LIYLSIIISSLITACNDNTGKIDHIAVGMTSAEVEEVLGTPSEKIELAEGPDGTVEIWHYESNGEIASAIQFTESKVSEVIPDFQDHQEQAAQMIHNSK